MPKYIEEKELREWVRNWFEMNRYYHPYSRSNDIPIPELYDILERMPTADVVERKDLDKITEEHEKIGYEKGYRDGYAQADVVEVVRCKNCRWGKETCGNIECNADLNVPSEYHGYDWFCPNGERRE